MTVNAFREKVIFVYGMMVAGYLIVIVDELFASQIYLYEPTWGELLDLHMNVIFNSSLSLIIIHKFLYLPNSAVSNSAPGGPGSSELTLPKRLSIGCFKINSSSILKIFKYV